MIVALLVVVPCVLVAVGGWALASRLGAFGGLAGTRAPAGPGALLGSASDYEGTWPVRQLQRLPAPLLVGIVVTGAAWLLAWLVVLVVGLQMLNA